MGKALSAFTDRPSYGQLRLQPDSYKTAMQEGELNNSKIFLKPKMFHLEQRHFGNVENLTFSHLPGSFLTSRLSRLWPLLEDPKAQYAVSVSKPTISQTDVACSGFRNRKMHLFLWVSLGSNMLGIDS